MDAPVIRGVEDVKALGESKPGLFVGVQTELSRRVLVRLLDRDQQPLLPKRFDIRRKALNRFCESEAVVPVYEVGETPDGQLYLIEPFFPLGSLEDQIQRGAAPWHWSVDIVSKTALVVGKAHGHGVSLFGLKPASVLLASAESPVLSIYGQAMQSLANGRPNYAAADAHPSPSSAVYSLALILAALLAGQPHYRGRQQQLLEGAAKNSPPRIMAVIEQALNPNPTARHPTAEMLSNALMSAVGTFEADEKEPDPIDWDELPGVSTPVVASDHLVPRAAELAGTGPSSSNAAPGSGPAGAPMHWGVDRSRLSVGEIYELERVKRLSTAAGDRLRYLLEPFLGTVQLLLDDGSFPGKEVSAQVAYELDQLREELYGEKPGEPLGSVIQGYFASLLTMTLPLLDVSSLKSAASERGVDPEIFLRIAESGTDEGSSGNDTSPIIKTADTLQDLFDPLDQPSTARSQVEWVVQVMGWTTIAVGGGIAMAAGAAQGASVLELSWLPPQWSAIVGGVIGVSGAIAGIKQMR